MTAGTFGTHSGKMMDLTLLAGFWDGMEWCLESEPLISFWIFNSLSEVGATSEKYNLSLYHLGPSGKVNPSTTILLSLITEKI